VLVESRTETMPDMDYIGTDHLQSIFLIAQYLCRVGPPPIFLAIPRVNFNAVKSENTYIKIMTDFGLTPQIIGSELMQDGWQFEAHGEAAMDAFFARGMSTDQSILCATTVSPSVRCALHRGMA